MFLGLDSVFFYAVDWKGSPERVWSGLIFIGYWALRGIDVDAFYRLQAMVFGKGIDVKTIIFKVLFDQFIYCVIWASPITALFTLGEKQTFQSSDGRR